MFLKPTIPPNKRSHPASTFNNYNGNNNAKKPKITGKAPDNPEMFLEDGLEDVLSQMCDDFTASQVTTITPATEHDDKEKSIVSAAKCIYYRDIILNDMKKFKESQQQNASSSSENPKPLEKKLESLEWGLDEIEKLFPNIPRNKKSGEILRKLRQKAQPMDTQDT